VGDVVPTREQLSNPIFKEIKEGSRGTEHGGVRIDVYTRRRSVLMAIQRRFFSMSMIVLLAGALVVPGAARVEQDGSATPSNAQTPASGEVKSEAPSKSPELPDAKQFANAMEVVRTQGHVIFIRIDIAMDLRLTSDVTVPVTAKGISEDDEERSRTIYLTDEPGTKSVVMMTKAGEEEWVYLATTKGVLKLAGRLTTGRLRSQTFKSVPLSVAMNGFDVEKIFWVEKLVERQSAKAKSGRKRR
jgi:hypothetical protein